MSRNFKYLSPFTGIRAIQPPLTSLGTSDSLLEGFSSEAVIQKTLTAPARGFQPQEFDEVTV
jgi:hypothetical protein